MRTSGLGELEAVLAVARHRNFRAAATELEVSTSALSHAVAALEARIGVRLFNRTTRSVSLSEAGAQFVDSIAPALSTIRGAIEAAGSFRDTVSGMLRINTSAGAARQVMPVFIDYIKRYPEMKLDIVTEGKLIDIVADRFDAGIRLADIVPQDMIAVPFGDMQRFAVVGLFCALQAAAHARRSSRASVHPDAHAERFDLSVGVRAARRSAASRRTRSIDARRARTHAASRARRSWSRVHERVECRCGSAGRHAGACAGSMDAAARRSLFILSRPPSHAGRIARAD
jgi:DNA-binding transcriptional LysR family regulator